METITPLYPSDRERVVVFLGFLTSEECRKACCEHAQPEVLAAALTKLWFEEIYIPSETAVEGIKPVPTPEACPPALMPASTPKNLPCWNGSMDFFELRLNFLINQVHGRAFFPDNDSWRGVLQHARYLLAELDPDPEWLRTMLEAMIQKLQEGQLIEGLRTHRQLLPSCDT